MGRSTACLCCSPRRGARRGTRAVRICPGEARALQSAAQRHLRQRATQNCDRQDSEIYLESATACDRSAVSHFRLLSALNLSITIPSKESLTRELVTIFSVVKCRARFGFEYT